MKDKIMPILGAAILLIIFIANFNNIISCVFSSQEEEAIMTQEPVIPMDKFWYSYHIGLFM